MTLFAKQFSFFLFLEEPASKKQKRVDNEENDSEVTSTAKVFEEENNW